jgi:peptidoglycan/xylan/chitin deacetylase (PgdA/CDA1 family)
MLEKMFKKITPLIATAVIGFSFITGCGVPPVPPVREVNKPIVEEIRNPVCLQMDDIQAGWLPSVQEWIVKKHSDNNIPLTLGVIPKGIDATGDGPRLTYDVQQWNLNPNLNIAQHGYDHVLLLEGLAYATQYDHIKKGKDLLDNIGVSPKSFIPPFGSADENTRRVVRDLGFNTFYSPLNNVFSPLGEKPLIIAPSILLCVNDGVGKTSVFKDYDTLQSEIKTLIEQKGVAGVLYHMQDFQGKDTSEDIVNVDKGNQIVDYANHLKQDGYRLLTVDQYYQYKLTH